MKFGNKYYSSVEIYYVTNNYPHLVPKTEAYVSFYFCKSYKPFQILYVVPSVNV